MPKPAFNYGRLDERLRALGFTARTQRGKARIHQHEQTGASIILPDAPFEEEALPHHLAVVRHVLEEYDLIVNVSSIEQLLELWQAREVDLDQRSQAVQRIDSVRAIILGPYGELPESTTGICEDRER